MIQGGGHTIDGSRKTNFYAPIVNEEQTAD